MRKSTLFISAALTAFMLAVLFGVVSAYQNVVGSSRQPEVSQSPSIEAAQAPVQEPTQAPAFAQPANITPETAASIAGKVLDRADAYSVELTQLDGVDVYLVTFSSGDLVYVSMQGQVISISKLPVTVISQSGSGGGDDGSGNRTGGEREGGEHEGEEHEGGDD